jgi:hypothetical protein
MRTIDQYFDIIDSAIRHSAVQHVEITYTVNSPISGTVSAKMTFSDESRLEFYEKVMVRAGRPVKEKYRYQYLKARRTIFRYDNAPHHRGLPNFPHHKHVGRKVVGATEATLGQVLKEIAIFMEREGTE